MKNKRLIIMVPVRYVFVSLLLFLAAFNCLSETDPALHGGNQTAESLLQSLNSSNLTGEARLAHLKKAYQLAKDGRNKDVFENVLFELTAFYLDARDEANYQRTLGEFRDFTREHQTNESERFLGLLATSKLVQDAKYGAAIDLGESLLSTINPHLLSKKDRLQTLVFVFTLNDLAKLTEKVGIAHFYVGSYESAHRYFDKALKYFEVLDNKLMLASMYGDLSAVSWSQGNFEKAQTYIDQAIAMAKQEGDSKSILHHTLNKAIYFFDTGEKDSARDLFLSVALHGDVSQFPLLHATALINLSHFSIDDKDFERAESLLNTARTIATGIKEEKKLNDVSRQLARVKVAKGLYDEAIPLLENSVAYYKKTDLKRDLAQTYYMMSDVYRKKNDFEKVAQYVELYCAHMMELQNQTRQSKIVELQERFDAQQRENEIKRLRNNNQIKTIAIQSRNQMLAMVFVVALLIILFISVELRRKRKSTKELETLSLSDPMTHIGNRRFFMANIETVLAHAKREDNNVGIFVIDIDHFKKINDELGHDFGDDVIVEFAERMKLLLRDSDLLVRWGGEEFVVAARFKSKEQASILAQKILLTISGQRFGTSRDNTRQVTCSVGGVVFPFLDDEQKQPTWSWLISAADKALYQAKNAGRNRWYIVANQSVTTLEELGNSDSIDELVESKRLRFETLE